MRKSQISVEFLMLFTVAVFLIVAILSFVPAWLQNASKPISEAQDLARTIKERAIVASLSPIAYESTIELPSRLSYINIEPVIDSGDSIVSIRDADSGQTLARAFLPKLNATDVENGNTLTVTNKTIGGVHTIIIVKTQPNWAGG